MLQRGLWGCLFPAHPGMIFPAPSCGLERDFLALVLGCCTVEEGLLPRETPPLLPPVLPLLGACLELGLGLAWPWDRAAAYPVHQLNLGLATFVTTSHSPVTPGQGLIFGGQAKMYTQACCSLPAALSHLGHPSSGDTAGTAQVSSSERWHCC